MFAVLLTCSPLLPILTLFCVRVPVVVSLPLSNGRAVHYNGSSLLQWKSVRLDVALLPGETARLLFI